MRSLQYLPISTVLALLLSIPCQEPAIGEEGFTPLFDGKSLAGWEGNEKVFRVEKGAIVAGSLDQKIDIDEKDVPAEKLFRKLFEPLDIEVTIDGETVRLKPKDK